MPTLEITLQRSKRARKCKDQQLPTQVLKMSDVETASHDVLWV